MQILHFFSNSVWRFSDSWTWRGWSYGQIQSQPTFVNIIQSYGQIQSRPMKQVVPCKLKSYLPGVGSAKKQASPCRVRSGFQARMCCRSPQWEQGQIGLLCCFINAGIDRKLLRNYFCGVIYAWPSPVAAQFTVGPRPRQSCSAGRVGWWAGGTNGSLKSLPGRH